MDEGRRFKNVKCKEQVFDVAFHPQHDLLAAAIVDGSIELWQHVSSSSASTKHNLRQKIHHHSGSCRAIEFTSGGEKLYSASADKSWQVIDAQGKLISNKTNAHESALNKIRLMNETFFASGDDKGVVKLWDSRQPTSSSEVMSWDAHTDFIADFDFCEELHTLVSASGDATLGVYDIRNQKHFYRSDDQESELHCVRIIKDNKKVLCGTQDGVMLSFNWGQWGDCSDRFPGHPETVDCMWKIDENTVVTGSSDGFIRVIGVMPNKILGVIGDHKGFPVENIKPNRDNTILASIAHDEKIRLWDVSMLQDDEEDDEQDDEEDEEDEHENSSEDEKQSGDNGSANDVEDADEPAEDDNDGDDDSDSSEAMSSDGDDSSKADSSDNETSSSDNEDEEEDKEDDRKLVTKQEAPNATSNCSKSSSVAAGEPKVSKHQSPVSKATKQKNKQGRKSKVNSDSEESDDSDDVSHKRKKLPTAREMFYSDL
jgi:hypothetical protein